MSKIINRFFKLNNGVDMPIIALGTQKFETQKLANECIGAFYKNGGRRLDTGWVYGNEKQIGDALKTLGIDRKEMFINTKVWTDNMGYSSTIESIRESMDYLQTDYIDLVHIHWPGMDGQARLDTWKAFEELYAKGVVRALGVSNFYEETLLHLMNNTKVKPATNQIEVHPGCFRWSIMGLCKKHGIVVEACSPLALNFGSKVIFAEPITAAAKRLGKSNHQVTLKWLIQHGIAPVPRSEKTNEILMNMDLDFELTPEEMKAIDAITTDKKLGWNFSDRMGGMIYDENTIDEPVKQDPTANFKDTTAL